MKVYYFALLIAAMGIGIAVADNNPTVPPSVHNLSPVNPHLLFAPVIRNAAWNCGSPSSSNARGTLINKNATPQTYIPIFKGQKLNEGNQPGQFVTIMGSAVTVAASSQKDVHIAIPNTFYQSASLNVGSVKANISPPPQTCIF